MDVPHPQDSSPEDPAAVDGVPGYQGWAARRLVLASHRIFVDHGGGADKGRNTDLVSESLEHRGMIYWCLSNINADVMSSSAAQTEADLQDEDNFHDGLTDFYHVWTLAEVFLLDSAPLPAAPLLRWLLMYGQSGEDEERRWELDEAERVALEADASGDSANPDSGVYWEALRSLVVSVSPRRAAALLRSHPEGRDNAGEVGALARQLEKMPLLLPERADGEEAASAAGGASGAEAHLDREGFFATWTRWRKSCEAAAARFGVDVTVGADQGGAGAGDDEQRRHLRWLWGALCGERRCLVEATDSWSGLFAAVLAFGRPGARKEEVAPLMRECLATYNSEGPRELFLTRVIRDASAGAVDSILKFAKTYGETLALSACATHLVDLLSRAEGTSVTNQQRSWFFRRLAGHLKAFPCGGWELAAAYLRDGRDIDAGGDDEVQLLRDLAQGAAPKSERAAHELVGWCHANDLGEETAAAVARARAAAWIGKTGFSSAAMGTAGEGEEEKGDGVRVQGACAKAAYWLGKAGGGVQLERLCAEVSERLMVEVPARPGDAGGVEAQRAVLAEADGVLAAIPPGITGPELSFLESYKEVADLLLARGNANTRLAGALAVNMLAPCDGYNHEGAPDGGHAALSAAPTPPPRTWAHLLRLSVPALEATAAAAMAVPMEEEGEEAITVTAAQVHTLLAKLQALVASETRVGSVCGVRRRSSSGSTLASAPAPYGFCDGGGAGEKEEVSRIRRALAACLGATMAFQNAHEAAPPGRRQELASGRRSEMLLGSKRLPAEALIAPRVAV
eukprot:g20317.t1